MEIKVLVTITALLVLTNGQQQAKETYSNSNKFPTLKACGRHKGGLEQAIVGGEKAELGAFPWMANIGYNQARRPAITKWLCGGTLITDRHVLTAAHCLRPESIREGTGYLQVQWRVVSVQLGDLDIDPTKQDGANPQKFDVDKVVYHEEYNNELKQNDIGLIKLKRNVEFTDLINPICLPSASLYQKLFVGESPKVAGWGTTSETFIGSRETHLMQVNVAVQELEVCRSNVTSAPGFQNYIIDSRVICAASPGKDSCQGDSGGPLMYFHQSTRPPKEVLVNWFQIGIVSYGYGCAREGFPGVYTRVSSYMSWIDKNIDY